MRRRLLAAALCSLLAAAALPASARVLVFAAASLTNSLADVTNAYVERTGADVVVTYHSSGTLARQIENGAPASVFVSANPDWVDYLAARGLIRQNEEIELCRNRLVLIAPTDSTAAVSFTDPGSIVRALGKGPLAIGDPAHVPAGRYAKAALEHLGLWAALARKTARAGNVRAALAFVERGAAPLGIVYATDARASSRVRVLDTFPTTSHPPIVYRAGLIRGRADDAARAFFAYLASPEARAILARYGFATPAAD